MILESSTYSVFFEKPESVQIPIMTLTTRLETIEKLIADLKEKGPFIAIGKNGPDFYTEPCFKLKTQMQGKDLYAWQPGANRKELAGIQHVILLGAKKFSNSALVYFAKAEEKRACLYAPSTTDTKIYAVSYQTFQKNLYTLFPPCSSNQPYDFFVNEPLF